MEHAPSPGDHVVHAVHGPGEVVGVETRDMPDGPVEYVSMDIDGMRVLVPLAELGAVGVRRPINQEEAEEILDLLGGDPAQDPGHRGRRRRNQKRLQEGQAAALAKIVRSLQALKADQDGPLKHRDKVHLTEAMDKLAVELAIALGVQEDDARALIAKAIEGNSEE